MTRSEAGRESGSLVLVKHVEALQAEVLRHVSTIGKRRVYAVVLKKIIEYFSAHVEACSLWKHCVVVSWSQPRSGFDTPRIAVHPLQSSAIHSVSHDNSYTQVNIDKNIVSYASVAVM